MPEPGLVKKSVPNDVILGPYEKTVPEQRKTRQNAHSHEKRARLLLEQRSRAHLTGGFRGRNHRNSLGGRSSTAPVSSQYVPRFAVTEALCQAGQATVSLAKEVPVTGSFPRWKILSNVWKMSHCSVCIRLLVWGASGNWRSWRDRSNESETLVWSPLNETFYLYYNAVGDQSRGIGLITSKPLTRH